MVKSLLARWQTWKRRSHQFQDSLVAGSKSFVIFIILLITIAMFGTAVLQKWMEPFSSSTPTSKPPVRYAPQDFHEPKKQQLLKTYGKLPLSFETNLGQTDSQVKFLSRGNGYSLFLTSTEAVLTLSKPDAVSRN